MTSQLCLDRIAAQKPPLNRPCPHICAKKNFIDQTHCSTLGMNPDTPFMTEDPDFNGPGKSGYCYCCCSCMTKDTPLEQSPGEFVFVQDVNAGETLLVAGRDLKWKPGVVKTRTGDITPEVYEGIYLLVYRFPDEEENRQLFVTPDHLFMLAADRTLKAVQHVIPGDKLARSDGTEAQVIFVAPGAYETGIHSIEMEGEFDGKTLDGHLLNANGLVTTDYTVQAHYGSLKLDPTVFFGAQGASLPEVGESDYASRFPSKELDAFLQDKSSWPRGFRPRLRDERLINVPANAKGFFIESDALQVRANGDFLPESDQTPSLNIFKLFGYMRAAYAPTIYLIDWNNPLPNAYSWVQSGQRFVLITGRLARLRGLFVEGLSIIFGCVQARLDGATCVGDADYASVSLGLRKLWPNDMYAAVAVPGLDQIKALFDCIKVQKDDNVCDAPLTDCRMSTYKRALSFMGIPDCAKPVNPFDLLRAVARKKFTEVVVTFSEPCEVATATTTDNYTLKPPVKITGAEIDPGVPDGTQFVLKVAGADPAGSYRLLAHDVLTVTGRPLNPLRSSVRVTQQ